MYQDETSPHATCTSCFLSSLCDSFWRETVFLLWRCTWSTGKLCWSPPWTLSSLGWNDLIPSVFSHRTGSVLIDYLSKLPLNLSQSICVFFDMWELVLGTVLWVQSDISSFICWNNWFSQIKYYLSRHLVRCPSWKIEMENSWQTTFLVSNGLKNVFLFIIFLYIQQHKEKLKVLFPFLTQSLWIWELLPKNGLYG